MSATSAPFGLRPAFHPSGLDRAQALADGITSGYGVAILKGQAVQYSPNAGVILPVLDTTTNSGLVSGAFAGVEWTDTTGRRRVSNNWPASTAYIAGSCIAYFYNDQQIVYEIQTDATMAQAAIGNEANLSNFAAGSTTTGLSQATLSASLVGSASTGQFRIVDIAPYADNAWGDPFVIVRVQVSNPQFVASKAAI
tara:strand:- start:2890 stop:3477 length:588 start_codon:yes stop_codon:yes gene_type:complete